MIKSEIKKLYKKFHVPIHIIEHMEKVCEIAEKIGKSMEGKGIKINLKNLRNAALTHDILRICDFKVTTGETFKQKIDEEDRRKWEDLRKKYGKLGHTKAATKILEKMGEPEIAKIVETHDFFSITKLKTWEQKILYYADKRVDYNEIVSLKERFKRGRQRNTKKKQANYKIKETEKKVQQLEKEIEEITLCQFID